MNEGRYFVHRNIRVAPRWNPQWAELDYSSADGAESDVETPDVVVDARCDMVLYGPRGDVLRYFEDRPFRGYKGAERG